VKLSEPKQEFAEKARLCDRIISLFAPIPNRPAIFAVAGLHGGLGVCSMADRMAAQRGEKITKK
jgi:hypothetical protein